MSPTYRLDRTPRPLADGPELDDAQRAAAQHGSGPLLVLAGPGTGKTTTLVEAVVDRVERRGIEPDEVLVLTFSRKAAEELRNRITARLGRTSSTPMSSTFHSFCYSMLRRWQPADLYSAPLRLLSAPEQDVRLRDLLTHSRRSGRATWPEALDSALSTRGFAREVHAVLSRARELGLEPADLGRVGQEAGRAEWVAAGAFMEEYLTVLDFEGAIDYAELIHRAVLLAETPRGQSRPARPVQGGPGRRISGHRPRPGAPAASRRGGRAGPHGSGRPRPEHLRVSWRCRARHPRLPDRFSPGRRHSRRCGRARYHAPLRCPAAHRVTPGGCGDRHQGVHRP